MADTWCICACVSPADMWVLRLVQNTARHQTFHKDAAPSHSRSIEPENPGSGVSWKTKSKPRNGA
jgi:hypothetical protein